MVWMSESCSNTSRILMIDVYLPAFSIIDSLKFDCSWSFAMFQFELIFSSSHILYCRHFKEKMKTQSRKDEEKWKLLVSKVMTANRAVGLFASWKNVAKS